MKRLDEFQIWGVSGREHLVPVRRLPVQLLPVLTRLSPQGRFKGSGGGVLQIKRTRD